MLNSEKMAQANDDFDWSLKPMQIWFELTNGLRFRKMEISVYYE